MTRIAVPIASAIPIRTLFDIEAPSGRRSAKRRR